MSHDPVAPWLKPARCCTGSIAGAASVARPEVRAAHACGWHGLSARRTGQRGVALVVALILLVVLTLVGLAAVRGTIMQQKMTANFSDRHFAFQIGEAGLRQAQLVVHGLPTPVTAAALATAIIRDCSPAGGNKCLANPLTSLPSGSSFIQKVKVPSFDAGSLAADQPQYVIEYMGNFKAPTPAVQQLSGCSGYAPCALTNNADYYRITVSSGPTKAPLDRATVTLQSMFRR